VAGVLVRADLARFQSTAHWRSVERLSRRRVFVVVFIF
jgi:hypothetical protein